MQWLGASSMPAIIISQAAENELENLLQRLGFAPVKRLTWESEPADGAQTLACMVIAVISPDLDPPAVRQRLSKFTRSALTVAAIHRPAPKPLKLAVAPYAQVVCAYRKATAYLRANARLLRRLVKCMRYAVDYISHIRLLVRQLAHMQIDLKETQYEIIYRLSQAAEFRDRETSSHLKRLSHYVRVIAYNLGLPRREVEILFNASPMHDIGKIGIPDSILLKPGKLTPEEFEHIKRHTIIGAQILHGSNIELLKKAEIIALTHHEKFNGQGYPYGLKGTEIPLEGRIVAVADVFDALTSKRPYKQPWPVSAAVELIKRESGQHFDPECVRAFLKGLKEILEIKETFL